MNSNGFWANYACGSNYISICMVDNALLTTPTTPTTPVPPKCATGWTDADGFCYKVNIFLKL
jgi:hypothetical protein